ncbi:MAG: GTPase HflX [Proteobacteria bacterium]|nr:GTPase HflX [Pseudomonadota bacterium]
MSELYGQTYGLKASQVRRLQNLYKRKLPRRALVSQDFARQLCELSFDTGRQVGALIARTGRVEYVAVGDAFGIELPDFKRVRGGSGRFRGLRLVHTHLHGEELTRDDLTDLQLLRLDAVVALVVDGEGRPDVAHYASLRPPDDSGELVEHYPPQPPSRLDFDFLAWIEALEEQFGALQSGVETGAEGERAVLVSVSLGRDPDAEDRIEEMGELARSAGVEILDVVRQRRPKPDPNYLIGKGKLQDLVLRAWQHGAGLVLFDRDLTATQVRHITDLVETRIVDRTQLILDIFAQHARSAEGRLQVELAQLRYRLPRLAGKGESMSRLAGGIGGRGPGETKLEVDRRRVRDRIRRLSQNLDKVSKQRGTQRARRNREGLPILSIVGYTNAGKSTLLNRLTQSRVTAEDQLFATVDPASRRLRFPRERDVIVTDTVGFIRDLPPDLIAGFRATLEEISDARVLLHVVDATSPAMDAHIEAVRATLEALQLDDKPQCLVLNKCDRLSPDLARRVARRLGAVPVSALTGEGLEELLQTLEPIVFSTPQPDEPAYRATGT